MRHIAVGFSVLLAGVVAGCDEHVASPDSDATGRAASRSAGQQLVADGIARSGTEWLGSFLDTRGDDPSARQLTAIRGEHAATLDSLLAAPHSGSTSSSARATVPPGGFAGTPAFNDDEVLEYPPIVLATEYSGGAEVYQTSVLVTAWGSSGSVTGGTSFKGDEVTITLVRETRNDVGSRPGLRTASISSTRSHDSDALVRCFERNALQNTTVQENSAHLFAVCAHYYDHYAEHTWPDISFSQPCGTMLEGQALAVANYEFGFLFRLLTDRAALWTTIVRDPGPVGHSSAGESMVERAWSGDCRRPVVTAEVGGPITRLSSSEYEARADLGGGATVHLYATRTDPGLPAANQSAMYLNGVFWGSGTHTTQYLPLGTYQLYTMIWDDLLGLSSESSAWIYVVGEETCDDPAASNAGEQGSCIYLEDYCWDPYATNYGEYGACTYASDGYCWDSYATNYGAYGECSYTGDGYCWDWYADNYGQYGGCSYGGWPPSPCEEWDASCEDPCSDWYMGWEACEDPCSDWYTGSDACEDPCSDWYFGDEFCDDPCSDWYVGEEPCDCDQALFKPFATGAKGSVEEGLGSSDYCDEYNRMAVSTANVAAAVQPRAAPSIDSRTRTAAQSATPAEVKARRDMLARSRKAGAEGARQRRREHVAERRTASSYAIMLLDQWKDPSLLSMVGRFEHGGRYIDVIYLPAKNPTALGWAQAVRTLQRDRQLAPRGTGKTRVLRIAGNGTERVTRTKGTKARGETVTAWKPLPPAALRTVEAGFKKRLLPQLMSSPLKATRNQQTVRLIRWAR